MKLKHSLSMALLALAAIFRPEREEVHNSRSPREELANTIRRLERESYVPIHTGNSDHERLEAFNASLITESSYQQALTDYAAGFRDPYVEAELEFWAPEVPVARRFEYGTWDSDEEFLSDGDDDERSPKSDFKEAEYTSGKVEASTKNRGLQITLDMDQLQGRPDWEEYYTQKLLRRIKRNSVRRAIALLVAGATTAGAKSWDTTAGKDPDQDVLTELLAGAGVGGLLPNRVGYGPTAASKRQLAHRAQTSAGGFASAAMNEETLAALLNVDQVLFSKSRYTSAANTKTHAAISTVVMFNAVSGGDTEDPSNIKRFVSMGAPEEGGGKFQVYSQRISAKRHVIAVGHYELIKLVIIGASIRKIVVS